MAGHTESGLGSWVTAFNVNSYAKKEDMYSANIFTFFTSKQAQSFADSIRSSIPEGRQYKHNSNEQIKVIQEGRNVIITWGLAE
jgi:hypothetical protein